MIKKGLVSSVDTDQRTARITFPETGVVTGELPIANHIPTLSVQQQAAVILFGADLADGVVIAIW